MKKVVVGVCGAGKISDIYIQNMTTLYNDVLDVRYITSKGMNDAIEKATKYNLEAISYDDMLEREDVDLIINLTPTFAHYELVKNALLHGKNVYSEKILTDSLDTTKELIELARSKKLYLGVAPDTFLGSSVQTAKRLIEDDIIGEVNSFTFTANRNNDVLLSVIRNASLPGGGIVLDFSIYAITALVALFGPIKRVGGLSRTRYKTHIGSIPGVDTYKREIATPNESIMNTVLEMQNGITGTVNINAESVLASYARMIIYGKRGIIILGDPDHFGDDVLLIKENMSWKPEAPITINHLSSNNKNMRGIGIYDMAKAIQSKSTDYRCNTELVLNVSEAIFKIHESQMSGVFQSVESTCKPSRLLNYQNVGIKRLAHVSFQAHDYDRMLAFYNNVLGIKPLFETKLNDLYNHIDNRIDKSNAGALAFLNRVKEHRESTWLTYLKVTDSSFIEIFNNIDGYTRAKDAFEDREKHYGYKKMNFEVDDINYISNQCLANGVKILKDIHNDTCGSLELTILDPDKNIIEFTCYNQQERDLLGMKEEIISRSHIKEITQVAYDACDDINMYLFYKYGLGLRHAHRKKYSDLLAILEKANADSEFISKVKANDDKPWIDYFEVGPHQYIELFYPLDKKEPAKDLSTYYGYQHISIEVEDINQAYNAIVANGIKPTSAINLGSDQTYQFWVNDPDGNRIEFHQYTKNSSQVRHK